MRTVVTVLFAAGMLWSTPAMACSIAEFLVVDGLGSEEAPTRSTDGAFPFFVDGNGGSPTTTVTGSDGTEHPGTVTGLASGYSAWTPDEPLAPGRYDVTIGVFEGPSDNGVLEVVEGEPELGAPALGSVALEMTKHASDETNCCDRATEEADCRLATCGDYDGCTVCWPVSNEYFPTLLPVIENPPSAYLIRSTVTAGGETFTDAAVGTGAGDANAPRIEIAPGVDGPYCLTVELIDMDGSSLGTSEERCFDISEFPEAGPTERDNTDLISQCASAPVDETDPNWVDYEEKPAEAVEESKEPVGGCSTAPGDADGSLYLMLLAFFAATRRRR